MRRLLGHLDRVDGAHGVERDALVGRALEGGPQLLGREVGRVEGRDGLGAALGGDEFCRIGTLGARKAGRREPLGDGVDLGAEVGLLLLGGRRVEPEQGLGVARGRPWCACAVRGGHAREGGRRGGEGGGTRGEARGEAATRCAGCCRAEHAVMWCSRAAGLCFERAEAVVDERVRTPRATRRAQVRQPDLSSPHCIALSDSMRARLAMHSQARRALTEPGRRSSELGPLDDVDTPERALAGRQERWLAMRTCTDPASKSTLPRDPCTARRVMLRPPRPPWARA